MTTNKQIRELKLENLIKEVVTLALFEQTVIVEQQPQQPQPTPPPQANPVASPAMEPETPMPSEGDAAPNQQTQEEPLTVDTMIERLNVIRGGRSFTDPEIYGQFTTFFKKLAPEQVTIVDNFLQGLTKIVVNVEQSSEPEVNNNPPPPPTASSSPPNPNAGGQQAPIQTPSAQTPSAPQQAGQGVV